MNIENRQRESITVAAETSSFMSKVYAFMMLSLIITGLTAYAVANTPSIYTKLYSSFMYMIVVFAIQIALIIAINVLLNKASTGLLVTLYVAFALTFGLTLSAVFLVYAKTDITSAFFITSGMFAALSIYGAVTKRDLTGLGNFMFMGLVGIIIASIVNLFLKAPAVTWAITYLGVFIFAGLTAYDTQRLKEIGQMDLGKNSTKYAISGALSLYLDFINMFLFILRIVSNRD